MLQSLQSYDYKLTTKHLNLRLKKYYIFLLKTNFEGEVSRLQTEAEANCPPWAVEEGP